MVVYIGFGISGLVLLGAVFVHGVDYGSCEIE